MLFTFLCLYFIVLQRAALRSFGFCSVLNLERHKLDKDGQFLSHNRRGTSQRQLSSLLTLPLLLSNALPEQKNVSRDDSWQ